MRLLLPRRMCARSHIRSGCRCRFSSQLMILIATPLLAVACLSGPIHGAAPPSPVCSCTECCCSTAQSRRQCAAESGNFSVRSFLGGPAAVDVAQHCNLVCDQLRRNLFGLEAAAHWTPACKVVLHATRQDYSDAVGQGASQTVGSSAISISGGRVTQRRIDLLATNAEQGLAALPHELVHVLFADAFPNDPPSKWAEEGLALLVDPADKRARHARDLESALRTHSTLPLDRFLSDVDYPASSQRAVFYAQSMSLVEYFTELDSPKEFVRYLRLSAEMGQDHALEAVYRLDRRELERRWRQRDTVIQLVGIESR